MKKCNHKLKMKVVGPVLQIPDSYLEASKEKIEEWYDNEHIRIAKLPSNCDRVFMRCDNEGCAHGRLATETERNPYLLRLKHGGTR